MLPNVPWILPLPHKRVINQLFTIIEENKKTRKPKLAGLLCIPFRN
jgi:hypothetical protein